MVFGELLSSLWNMNDNDKVNVKDNDKDTTINEGVDLPQGVQLLKYRSNKIQRLEKQTNMLSASNGYSDNENMFRNQELGWSSPGNIEGFTGMIGPTAANKRNEQELAELRKTEDAFNKKMSNYATAQQTLMDKARSFITSTDSSNKFANKNVRLANGEIGYVNSHGIYKWYPSKEIFDSTAGNNGCPSSYVNVDVESNNYNMPGSSINTNPKLNVGTFMTQGQSCGREGRNIYATQSANTRDVVPRWEGCYKTSSNDGMVFQKDLGEKVSVATCKTRAADLGYSIFSLRDNGTGCSQCYIGNDINTAKTGGVATKAVTSYSFVQSPDAVVSGLLRNGQVGVGKDAMQVTSMKTQFNAVPGCLPNTGAEINTNTLVGTYGANCKAPVSIKCPPGYTGPNADNMCTAGWTSACGEACAKSKCSAAGGSWIPLDYGHNPYTCQMHVPNNLVKINVSTFVSWNDANTLAINNGGRLPTKDEFKAATINVGNIDMWMPASNGTETNFWVQVGTRYWPLHSTQPGVVNYPPTWGVNNTPAGYRPGPTGSSSINYIYIVKDPANTMPTVTPTAQSS